MLRYDLRMATPLVETLSDLLSASSGALVGALVTGLFNRGRHRQLSNQVEVGRRELDSIKLENDRLLEVIRDREKTIMEMQMKLLEGERPATKKRQK